MWLTAALETTKPLIRLHERAGLSAPKVVVCSAISRFSHDEDIVNSAQGADIKMQPNLYVLLWTTLQPVK